MTCSVFSTARFASSRRYYQLTHDYLVPSLREWLTRKQKESRRRRVELLLVERVAAWTAKPENWHLPSVWEWGTIRALTAKRSWTAPQRQMMGKAGQYHAVRGAVIAVLLAVVGLTVWEGFGRIQARNLRDRLLVSTTRDVPAVVDEMGRYRRWVNPLLVDADLEAKANKDARKELHISLALLPVDSARLEYLYGRLLKAEPQEIIVIRAALEPRQQDLTQRLWTIVENRSRRR
jgi:eukaryotic-like serine/threonine-protein kinase